CFCMYSRSGCCFACAMRCTQCPTSASGSGMYCDFSPLLIGFQFFPASSLRNAPAAEIAMKILPWFRGSSTIVCRHIPPAPGCHCGPVPCPRSPESSSHVLPPFFEINSAASSTPAYTVSGSVSEGSRCHTRLNSHGWGVPSYHWCVPGTPSYTNLFPTGSQVLPPSFERWIICPNQPDDCEA